MLEAIVNDAYDAFVAKIKTSQACAKLVRFIVDEYPQCGYKFSTSWTCYACSTTQEEDLITEVYQELDLDNVDTDWFDDLPSTLLVIARELRPEDEDAQDRHDQAFAKFCADAMYDLFACHLRETV
jgi:hypothetical protein